MSEKNTILPDPDKLNNLEYGRFVLSNLAARRAKQIKDGAPPLVRSESNHPLSIALAEIAAGKISPNMQFDADGLVMTDESDILIEEKELGLLLPSLDEIGTDDLEDEEHDDHDDEPGADVASITDLLEGGADEDDVVDNEPGSDNLSLSDIEEEESSDEESEDSL